MGAKWPPNVSSPNFIWIGCRAPMFTHFCLKWVSNGRPTFQLTQFCLHWMSNDHPTPNSSSFILTGCWVATYALFHLMLFNLGVKLPLDALIHEVCLNWVPSDCPTLRSTNFIWITCQMVAWHSCSQILFEMCVKRLPNTQLLQVGLGNCSTPLFTQFCLIWASGSHPMP
jgi:hypothetical protein